MAIIILGVGGAALLGLGGIAGLYFTRPRPVAEPAADSQDGGVETADADAAEPDEDRPERD